MISSEQIVGNFLDILQETFERVGGRYLDRNTSLFETLATISAEEASVPVSATCATLAAQVEHIRFYLDVTADFMEGHGDEKLDWGAIWRTVSAVSPEEWDASKARLQTAYQRLLTVLKTSAWDDDETFGGALNAVAHTAYHLGEIRQALCTLRTGTN